MSTEIIAAANERIRCLIASNAELVAALVAAQRAIDSMKNEAETGAQGDEQMMLDAAEQISNQGLEAIMAIRATLAKAESQSS